MDLLAQMETFVRVVDAGSLSAAARAKRLSLPAVSRQLRALEADLGTKLIARSTRRLAPTDAGRRWYAHCLRVLREVDDARAAVGEAHAIRGTLTVSAAPSLGSAHLIPRLPALATHYPGLHVDLRLEDQMVDVVGDAVDVAVRAGVPPPDSASLIAHPLFRYRRIVVAAPSYLRKHGIPRVPAELSRHDCLVQLSAVGPLSKWRFVREEREQAVDIRGGVRTNSLAALQELAGAGMGLALLPDWLVAEDLAARRLRHVLDGWESPPVTAWAIHRVELRGSPRVQAFLNEIRTVPGVVSSAVGVAVGV